MDYRAELGQYFRLGEDGMAGVEQDKVDGSTYYFNKYRWKPDGYAASNYEVMFEYTGNTARLLDGFSADVNTWYPVDSDIVLGISWEPNAPSPQPGTAAFQEKFKVHIRHKNNHLDAVVGEVTFINRLEIKTEGNAMGSWAKLYNNTTYNVQSTARLEFSPDGYWYWSGNGTVSKSGMWSADGLPGSAAQIRITSEEWRIACTTNITTALQDLSTARYFEFSVGLPPIGEPDNVGGIQVSLEVLEKGTGRVLSSGELTVYAYANR